MKRVEENLGSIGNSKVPFVDFIFSLFFLFHPKDSWKYHNVRLLQLFGLTLNGNLLSSKCC